MRIVPVVIGLPILAPVLGDLLVYGVLVVITLLIFFLPMTQSYRILRRAKNKELDTAAFSPTGDEPQACRC